MSSKKKDEENKKNSMLYISFNQDNSFFAIGTEKDFYIYKADDLDKGSYKGEMNGGIGIVEMVENSNFLILAGGGEKPKFDKKQVIIWDDFEKKIICELKFSTEIKLVQYKKNYLFVICQKRIYIFNFETFENICSIDTGNNTKELIAINKNESPSLIAYPSENKENEIEIMDYLNKENNNKVLINFNDSVSKISMNNDGRLIVSANGHGTIIRIHSCKYGTLLMEFKRGIEKAIINTICFDNESNLMAVSSSKGTIHIFTMRSTFKKLNEIEKQNPIDDFKIITKNDKNKKKNKDENKIEENPQDNKNGENKNENIIDNNNEIKNENIINNEEKNEQNNININNKSPGDNISIENSKSLFGHTEKSFAKVRLKSVDSICAFIKTSELVVVTSDSNWYIYKIDLQKGGDCEKQKGKRIELNK